MKVSWDVKELTDFANNLASFTKFETYMKQAAQQIARVLLQHIKGLTPIGETGKLVAGWDGNEFLIKTVKNGFEIDIINNCDYATEVNDGHRSFNQYGGPYKVHNRVKVKSAWKWQTKGETYVFGHFFVERGILQLNDTNQVEQIIMRELQKWWESV